MEKSQNKVLYLFFFHSIPENPIQVEVQANDKPLKMEVDTGTVVSVISHKEVQDLFPTVTLTPTTVVLRTYTGQHVMVLGEISVNVRY